MGQRNNFIGLSGFVFWSGVVVNRDDPLKLGRCQVRIFGWHTENSKLLPNENLPWATASFSSGTSKSFATPLVGDWVWGFFMDGESGQFPIYVGVFQGKLSTEQVSAIENYNISSITGEVLNPSNGFSPPIGGPGQNLNVPSGQSRGIYSNSPLSRSVVANTAIANANDQLVHVCDITADMKKTIATVTFQISEVIQKIRAAIKALWSSTLASPFADQIRQAKNYIESELKIVQKVIKNARDMSDALVAYAKSMKDILDYIATLPEKAAKLLSECLQTATRGITDSINEGKALAASSVVKTATSNAADLAKAQASEATAPTYQLP